MMFQVLSSRFQDLFRRLRGEGKLEERHITGGIRDLRRALLEADVNLRVVQVFLRNVKERAMGEKLTESWTPVRKLQAIVQDELVNLLSGKNMALKIPSSKGGVILLVGLQGAGKTATAAKLGRYICRQGRNAVTVCADTRRPAARQQLEKLSEKAGVRFFSPSRAREGLHPKEICREAVAEARNGQGGVVILDTAGRLHVDSHLMAELKEIRDTVHPDEVLFVADAMTGQDVVRSSQAFQEEIGLSGVVLTKMDGDARGGAALSIVSVTGIPIKFIGTGEGKDDLDVFSPERMAARILGMGDLQGFLEKVESTIGGEPARVSNPDFDLEQVRRQLRKLRKAGPIQRLIEMLPGVNFPADVSGSNDQLRETLAILDSMTPGERNRPDIMNGDRRRRVARGSGTRVETVNRFLKQFAQIRKFMRRMPGGNMPGTWKKALKTSTR